MSHSPSEAFRVCPGCVSQSTHLLHYLLDHWSQKGCCPYSSPHPEAHSLSLPSYSSCLSYKAAHAHSCSLSHVLAGGQLVSEKFKKAYRVGQVVQVVEVVQNGASLFLGMWGKWFKWYKWYRVGQAFSWECGASGSSGTEWGKPFPRNDVGYVPSSPVPSTFPPSRRLDRQEI